MTYYKHVKTGNIYLLRGEILMENPETHEWEPGIIYYPAGKLKPDGRYEEVYEWCAQWFVRSKARFEERFEKIDGKDIVWER